jgi:hypothetical protein
LLFCRKSLQAVSNHAGSMVPGLHGRSPEAGDDRGPIGDLLGKSGPLAGWKMTGVYG